MKFGISIAAQVVFVYFISVRRIVFWGSSEPFIPSPQGVHPRKWTLWDCLQSLALLSQKLMVRISGFLGGRWDLNWWPCHVVRAWLSTCTHWSASASSQRTIWKLWGSFDTRSCLFPRAPYPKVDLCVPVTVIFMLKLLISCGPFSCQHMAAPGLQQCPLHRAVMSCSEPAHQHSFKKKMQRGQEGNYCFSFPSCTCGCINVLDYDYLCLIISNLHNCLLWTRSPISVMKDLFSCLNIFLLSSAERKQSKWKQSQKLGVISNPHA